MRYFIAHCLCTRLRVSLLECVYMYVHACVHSLQKSTCFCRVTKLHNYPPMPIPFSTCSIQQSRHLHKQSILHGKDSQTNKNNQIVCASLFLQTGKWYFSLIPRPTWIDMGMVTNLMTKCKFMLIAPMNHHKFDYSLHELVINILIYKQKRDGLIKSVAV